MVLFFIWKEMKALGKFTLSVSGADELLKHLRDVQKLEKVKKIVADNTTALHRKSVKNAQFKGHYVGRGKKRRFVKPTGATRQSIKSELLDSGLSGRVSAGTHYSGYLEVGTRKMEAQPFIKPAFEEVSQQFQDDLTEVMK